MRTLETETALAIRGENVLGHRRGISNSSTAPARTQTIPPKEPHTLTPVAEHDLEKGLNAPAEGNDALELTEDAHPRYASSQNIALQE